MISTDFTGASPEAVLKSVFGYDSFRPLQKEIISHVLSGGDTLAIMPTGGGKSLCYQIPALIFDGLTVVVSPLISLMQDQVAALNATGVNAVFLNSTLEWSDYLDSMNAIRRGEIKLVYLSPEGLNTAKIRDLLHEENIKVSCITIDEAHCVSEWGHDFRPDYLEIAAVRSQFPSAVCLALTATATEQVREDIIRNLRLNNPAVLISSFDRPNIYLNVLPKINALEQVIDCIRRHWGESGIIYCFSRRQVDELTEKLERLGYSVLNYHAGLTDEVRAKNQTLFIRDEVQIMVATLAFGMGIDKPNVRFVVHYDMPKSLEQYYQEIGRAGRDGLPCEALLLYSAGDAHKIRFFFEEVSDRQKAENLLQGMLSYAESRSCRRQALLAYFGEKFSPKRDDEKSDSCCDLCSSGPAPLVDVTIPVQKLMSCIIRTKSRFGATYLIDILLGSHSKRILENGHNMLSTFDIGHELNKKQWMEVVAALIDQGYLEKTPDYSVLLITHKGLSALRGRDKIALSLRSQMDYSSGRSSSKSSDLRAQGTFIPSNRASSGANGGLMFPKPASDRTKKTASPSSFVLHKKSVLESDQETAPLIDALKKWRKKKASEENVPPYVIFGDKTLYDIASKKPSSIDELLDCNGIGEKKAEKFGDAILRVLEDCK